MTIPSSGRVVIVDDKIEEISTLMDALSQSGIGFTYFNGVVDKLPTKPLDGITYMFLEKNENVNIKILHNFCSALDCDVSDITLFKSFLMTTAGINMVCIER